MIIFLLIILCGPIGWAGVACLIAGEYRLGLLLVGASWALGCAWAYLAWRVNSRR